MNYPNNIILIINVYQSTNTYLKVMMFNEKIIKKLNNKII
jgi:hypothetical protein